MSEMEWLSIFADNLVGMLEDAHMTQRDLAHYSGVSEATISKYISKKQLPGLRALVNIADALNCSFDELMDFGDRID